MLNDTSLYLNDASQRYAAQADLPANSGIRADLQALSSDYLTASNKVTAIHSQLDTLKIHLRIIDTDVLSMMRHITVIQNGAREVFTNVDNFKQTLGSVANITALIQPALDRFPQVISVFVSRSLRVFKANFGQCGHLAFIYSVIGDVCFFAATR